MTIRFVNHSSFIIEHNGVSIISDPWLEGKVFNNGWDLISPTRLKYEDFATINYIWFSHEHPDHFYPPNLKKIAPEYKSKIKILFQSTIDKRVSNYCLKSGFKEVIEMHDGEWLEIGKDFKVLCEYYGEGDSWICYKVGGLTILNTNDCGIRQPNKAKHIKERVGEVDILLTQFSYAYWAGNVDEVAYRRKIADEKLEWMKFQCDVFKPKVTIPIASYIYFCHEENFYLNDSVNTAEKTFNFLKKNTSTTPVVLYNGDEYSFNQDWNSANSISKYKADFDKIKLDKDSLIKNNKVPLEDIYNQSKLFIKNLKSGNNFLVKVILRDTYIALHDYNKTYKLSLKEGLVETDKSINECDVVMSSESLLFCLKYPYGLDTTQINGRLQKPKQGNYSRFYNFFRIDQQKSRGQDITYSYLFFAGIRKIKVRLGLLEN
jgi:UDP-MurNAc hydroxylase